ncbi:MAG: Wadjet anti-phage system protein JetD domain-containing protein [Chitinophagales bacterium]
MLTPQQIQKKALRLYPDFLLAAMQNQQFFPLEIKGSKGRTTIPLHELFPALQKLLKGGKEMLGYGYTVELKEVNTRHAGLQSMPKKIYFETQADYLKFLKKEQEFVEFQRMYAFTLRELPQLEEWLLTNPLKLVKNLAVWVDVLKVCHYFMAHPQPNLYIRQLPIAVHTKFIEQHTGILKNLLDELLEGWAIRYHTKRFEERYYLKYDEPTIRLRILDSATMPNFPDYITDLSLTLSELQQLEVNAYRVFIVENKQTFLAFPKVANSLIIWGKGFGVELLKEVLWLEQKDIIYWGDMDVQGFQILSQLRAYFPQTESLLMDKSTFEAFEVFAVKGKASKVETLVHLTEEEQAMFAFLKERDLGRLEQERINYAYLLERLEEKM